jgi:hypothetical protein
MCCYLTISRTCLYHTYLLMSSTVGSSGKTTVYFRTVLKTSVYILPAWENQHFTYVTNLRHGKAVTRLITSSSITLIQLSSKVKTLIYFLTTILHKTKNHVLVQFYHVLVKSHPLILKIIHQYPEPSHSFLHRDH